VSVHEKPGFQTASYTVSSHLIFPVAVLACMALLLTSAGCDVLTGESTDETRDAVRQRVETARQTWQDQGGSDYRVKYSQQVADVVYRDIEVFVSNGTVDSVRASTNLSEKNLIVTTVDSFFNRILERVGEDDSQFSVNFNEEMGYPVEYQASFSNRPNEGVVTQSVELNSMNQHQV